jgi:2,3-bisphosphoglycerate-dependent phosphoglycerate mutase
MHKLLIFLMMSFTLISCKEKGVMATEGIQPEGETTTYYFIRHAEKDRSDPKNEDPPLTEAGLMRATLWSRYFDTIPLDQIFSTDYQRTRQTVANTAAKKNIPVQIYEPSKLYSEEFRYLTNGQNILIAGHSNTTPAFVNSILGEEKFPDMMDNDNSSIYKMVISGDQKVVTVDTVKMPN